MTLHDARCLIAAHFMFVRAYYQSQPHDYTSAWTHSHGYMKGVLESYKEHGLHFLGDDYGATISQCYRLLSGLKCYNRS